MDKWSGKCYTGAMKCRPLLLSLLLSLPAWASESIGLSQWDVEGMFVQAKAMLEDRSIQDVSAVPMLLETCARENHPGAAHLLIDVYEGKFKGLEANLRKAADLARGLAESDRLDLAAGGQSDVRTEAMYRLALYLEKGNGCEKNEAEACSWMRRAARRGMPQANVELARYLMNGLGTKADPRQAWQLLHIQAKANPKTPHIFFYMGHMSAQGIGMPRDARKAFELFRMGAMQNDARCLNNLGTMFEKGYPTPRDPESALKLYRIAAYLGNREASANMQRLAFKEGVRAQHISSTPARRRIDNATLHLIQALPVSEYTRERLRDWLTLSPDSEES